MLPLVQDIFAYIQRGRTQTNDVRAVSLRSNIVEGMDEQADKRELWYNQDTIPSVANNIFFLSKCGSTSY